MDYRQQVLSFYGAKLSDDNGHHHVGEDTTDDGYGIYATFDNYSYEKIFMNESSARDEVKELIEAGESFSCDEHLEPEWEEMWYNLTSKNIDIMFDKFAKQEAEDKVFPLAYSLVTDFLTDNKEFECCKDHDEDINDFRPRLLKELANAILKLAEAEEQKQS
jgi:hypothetical protein